jgi:hypothetical protein
VTFPSTLDPVDLAFGAAVLVAALFASGHAVIYKRESRSASLWVVLIWVMPALGPILYLLMGVNRVKRRCAPTWCATVPSRRPCRASRRERTSLRSRAC